ncbi:DUF5134 domain-containing protein [Streptacidiphilus jiangxiensis]|uniref:DUF5134 domain-containing protein n=1 Tax=Streptacidiphilus jiangxiensis TaxID=235985 RepID=A0A1H7X0T9_STRJI|nr:DUF5134 domain-containing protein [Streptacidiphilus jiangxiensis]SEM27393.1 protein of unknown function [Streptacidiphilus jiangxiensis]
MGGGGVLVWLLVLLCGGAGAYCAARLCLRRAAPPAHRAADATEALMGLGMAAMAAGLATPTGVGVAVYGSAALVSLVLGARASGHRAHHAYHLVGHAAMVYMTVAMSTGPHGIGATRDAGGMAGMAGMSGAPGRGLPLLTGALLLGCVAVSLSAGLRLVPTAATTTDDGPRPLWRAAALPDACRVVMGLSMATMLALL